MKISLFYRTSIIILVAKFASFNLAVKLSDVDLLKS